MAVTIDEATLQNMHTKYAEMYDTEAEQKRARLTQFADVIAWKGEKYVVPTEETNIQATGYTGYNVNIADSTLKEGKRIVWYNKYYISFAISKDMLLDKGGLDNGLARRKDREVAATGRAEDEQFLGVIKDASTGKYRLFNPETTDATTHGHWGGLLNKNYAGTNGETPTALNLTKSILNGGNLLPIDYTSSGTGVSNALKGTFIDKVFLIQQRLQELEEFDPESANTICCAISPAVKRQLLMLEAKNNHDYGFASIGDIGTTSVVSGLGLTVVMTNMLPVMDTLYTVGTDAGSKGVRNARMVPFWLKNRVQIAYPKRTEFEILTINDKVDVRYRILATGMIGACRKDEKSTFVMPVAEEGVATTGVAKASLSLA